MPGTTKTEFLLFTKLHRPRIDRNFVGRPHLLEQLDQRCQRPLTLISAPAGYGKTSLVISWMEASDSPNAWVSLDEGDNDLQLFLSYLLAAINPFFPLPAE